MRTLLLCALVLLAGCERAVDFKLDDVTPSLVVEGVIENGTPPTVILSTSTAYFSQLDLTTLTNSFVHNAEVYVSNGTLTHKLKEYTRPIAPGLSYFYYSIDSANLATAFVGELNRNYSLRIV